MRMLALDNFTSFGTAGSGNQVKFWVGNNLVKLNSKDREDEKEVSASFLSDILQIRHVKYEKGEFEYKGKVHKGCVCESYFTSSDEQEITLYQLLTYEGVEVSRNESALSFFDKTVSAINRFTGISIDVITNWLMQILVFDFLICNTDRHLSNITIIECNGVYSLGTIFDNGQSFLGTNGELTQREIIERCRKYKSRPFSSNTKSNLINLVYASEMADRWHSVIIQKYGNILNLPINTGHKKILKYRFEQIKELGARKCF